MGNFIVSARKYRPTTFDSVVGQASITETLNKAIANDHLAHAYLFCGPRGVGKTTCARIFAKTINSEGGTFDENEDFSFNIFELDAASNNSVDDIRSLTDQVRIPPQTGKYKVYIIDEVHMLSQAAFNAFLKTLEEPPPHAIFILATTEKHKIIPTILSRCQIFDFNRIGVRDIANHLHGIAKQEGLNSEPDALIMIAQKADGALRDALSIFDQMVSFSGKDISYASVIKNLNILDYDYYFRVMDSILQANIPNCLLLFNEILGNGFDGHHFVAGLSSHFRDLLVCKDASTLPLLEVGDNIKAKYQEQASICDQDLLLKALRITGECDIQYKSSKNQRLLVEVALMRLCSLNSSLEKKNDSPSEEFKINIQPRVQPTIAPTNTPKLSSGTLISVLKKEAKPVEQPSNPMPPPTESPKEVTEQKEAPTLPPEPERKKSAPVAQVAEKKSIPKANGLNLSTSSISIKEMLSDTIVSEESPDEEEEVISQEEIDKNPPVDKERFNAAWMKYAEEVKKVGKESFYTTLTTKIPTVSDSHMIQLTVEHQVEASEMDLEKTALLEFLREELDNSALQLTYEIVELPKEKKLYTNRDKYQRMTELNPNLQKLKQKLDLDIDL